MTKNELRIELKEIERIFLSAKYYELDFKYVNSIRYKEPLVYKTFFLFVERIFHSISVALILDLCKLFDGREKFSLIKLRNKMVDNYEKSELIKSLPKNDFLELFSKLDNKDVENLLIKIKTIRDEYYAHLDRTRTDFEKIKIFGKETAKLISVAEEILKGIELRYFETDIDFNLTIGELGHSIFERLSQWEKYREKYGLLKN